MARGSARAGRDCVAFLLSLIPAYGGAFLSLRLPLPLTTRPYQARLLPFRRPTPFCFSFAPRYDGEDGSHRLRSTATPQGSARAALAVPSRLLSIGVTTRDFLDAQPIKSPDKFGRVIGHRLNYSTTDISRGWRTARKSCPTTK